MIIIKTSLSEIPNTCKECEYHIDTITKDVACPILKDWICFEEYKTKKKLKNCPLEVQQ